MSESPHRGSITSPEPARISSPPTNHIHDLPPPPPIPTEQVIPTKQTSPPKQIVGAVNPLVGVSLASGMVSPPPQVVAAPPPPPPPPMPSNNVQAPPSGPVMNGDLIKALTSPPKLNPVKDRVLGKLGPPADPRNDLLKVSSYKFVLVLKTFLF